jgi:DNA-binding NtrC family response regulator
MELVEMTLIEQALRKCQGRVPAAMEMLGIAKKTLYDKLHRHGIDVERFRS